MEQEVPPRAGPAAGGVNGGGRTDCGRVWQTSGNAGTAKPEANRCQPPQSEGCEEMRAVFAGGPRPQMGKEVIVVRALTLED